MRKNKIIISFLISIVLSTIALIPSLLRTKFFEIDASVLQNILATDWTNTELLMEKGMCFVRDDLDGDCYFGVYGNDDVRYSIKVLPLTQKKRKNIKSYKSIDYVAYYEKTGSLFEILRNKTTINYCVDFYINQSKTFISVREYTSTDKNIAFYQFFNMIASTVNKETEDGSPAS